MKRLINIGSLAAVALAAAAGVPTPASGPIAQQVVQQAASGAPAPATQAPTAAKVQIDVNPFLVYRMSRSRHDFIWNGVAKRGNRRGRSHWNYNR